MLQEVFLCFQVEKAVAAITKSQGYLAKGKLKDAFLTSKKAIQSSGKILNGYMY